MNRHFNNFIKKLSCFASMIATFGLVAIPQSVLCTEGTSPEATIEQIDIVKKGLSAFSSAEVWMTNTALAAFPVALLVVLFILLFARDPRKISGLLYTAAIVCVAAFVVLLVQNDVVITILEEFAAMFK